MTRIRFRLRRLYSQTNGYLYDTMHPNAKGINVTAHKIREWVNTLSRPRIDGKIPAWSE